MTSLRSVVVGTGSSLPARAVTNAELTERVDTSDEWIVQRTGIRQRYLAGPEETTSVLGTRAGLAALDDAGLGPDDIDLVICATSTPDHTFPSTATQIQAALGFLGLGVQPPTPDWGASLQESKDYVLYASWTAIFPGLALVVSSLAVILIGRGLQSRT